MQFDTALNAIWLAVGVFALIGTWRARRLRTRSHAPAWLHISGVALIIAALFPYISATDDVLRIQHMTLQRGEAQQSQLRTGTEQDRSHQSDSKKSTETLIRLYEAMDAPVAGTIQEIPFTLFFVGLVVMSITRPVTRRVTLRNGRSPPAALVYC